MGQHIGAIVVVVPSRNEAELLPRALNALEIAATRFTREVPDVPVSLTVVLDSTVDDSMRLLSAHPKVHVECVSAGRVGLARNAGIVAAVLRAKVPAEQLWVATTDADSMVPADWLERHYAIATEGAHVLTGTVEPDPSELSSTTLSNWYAGHELREGHPHIHGANLGMRADVFEQLGGFGDQELHEDRDFVAQARCRGYVITATDSCRVCTSGRIQSRLTGGFADFLANLDHTGQQTQGSPTTSPVG
jgi:GT2 family glycosyltransferase